MLFDPSIDIDEMSSNTFSKRHRLGDIFSRFDPKI